MNVIQIEHAEAIVRGAEATDCPVVLQISENTVRYHGSLAPIALASLRIAQESTAAVCVHLDRATTIDQVREAVGLGISSVRFDGSSRPHEEHVAATREVVAWCHQRGVGVEGELGEFGGKEGPHSVRVHTDPDEAARFVAATQVDSLAVAVASSNSSLTRDTKLDERLIAAIADRVSVPLVLDGSSGVPDEVLCNAIAAGMTKINIATHLDVKMTRALRSELEADPSLVDPRKYLGQGREAVSREVARLLTLLSGDGSGGPGLAPQGRLS
jgi:fructose-bisphosphate aldolase class II